MERINVGRYSNRDTGYHGWVGGKKWIVFYRLDGKLMAYNRGRGGAVVGNPAILEP